MSIAKVAAKILGVFLPILAPTWSASTNGALVQVEAYIAKAFGTWLTEEAQKLAPQLIAGEQKLATLSKALVDKLQAEGMVITNDVARLIAQRAFLQIVPTLETDVKALLADLKAFV